MQLIARGGEMFINTTDKSSGEFNDFIVDKPYRLFQKIS